MLLFWQACTEEICDPNEILYLPVSFEVEAGAQAPAEKKDLGSLLQIVLAAIGAGLFALAMPCTYPLIPITISFFTKQAAVCCSVFCSAT